MRQQILENRDLDRLAFGRGLDHQIGLAQIGQLQRGGNPGQRGAALILGDFLAADRSKFL